MEPKTTKLNHDLSGYYFIGLIVLAIAGFWPTYFSKFIDGSARFLFYFHFHTVVVTLWILMLIVQPLLIRNKKPALHRILGKSSLVLFPMVVVSILLLFHVRHYAGEKDLDLRSFITFKDLLIMATFYSIGMLNRQKTEIHARAMIATGIVFIEPALFRLLKVAADLTIPIAYLWTIFIIYTLLGIVIIKEKKEKRGRWIFPMILGMYVVAHGIILLGIHVPYFDVLSNWFVGLPLTQTKNSAFSVDIIDAITFSKSNPSYFDIVS